MAVADWGLHALGTSTTAICPYLSGWAVQTRPAPRRGIYAEWARGSETARISGVKSLTSKWETLRSSTSRAERWSNRRRSWRIEGVHDGWFGVDREAAAPSLN